MKIIRYQPYYFAHLIYLEVNNIIGLSKDNGTKLTIESHLLDKIALFFRAMNEISTKYVPMAPHTTLD
jgi:hypothetical protein